MKINNILIAFVLSVFLIGCSSDSDESSSGSPNDPTAGNRLGLGESANDLLSDNEFTTLTVEFIVDDSVEANSFALNDLEAFFEDRIFKDQIDFIFRQLPLPESNDYTINQVREIEDDNRTEYNTETDIAVSVLYLNGSNEQDEGNRVTLGTAYRNTSIVIYKGAIDEASTRPGAPPVRDIESATLQHEFGHLFGLVDIGSPAQSDHEDENSRAHCNIDGCLMIASVEFASGMLGMSTVPDLDARCIEDLQANGGK